MKQENNHSSGTIMVFNAHPDDSEMAMGGTLILLRNAGFSIVNVCLTGGEAGTFGSKEIREKEFKNAQKLLGSLPVLLDFADGSLENNTKTREAVVKLIRTHKPDLIFAPYLRNDQASYHGMMNTDHAVCGHIISEAVKISRLKNIYPGQEPHTTKSLYFYMIPENVNPNLHIDITEVIEEMKTLISSYDTQMKIQNIMKRILSMKKYFNSIGELRYREQFISEMPLNFTSDIFQNQLSS